MAVQVLLAQDGSMVLPPDVLRQLQVNGDVMLNVEVREEGSLVLSLVPEVEIYSQERENEFAEAEQMTNEQTARVQAVLARFQ